MAGLAPGMGMPGMDPAMGMGLGMGPGLGMGLGPGMGPGFMGPPGMMPPGMGPGMGMGMPPPGGGGPGRRLFVSNLSFETEWRALKVGHKTLCAGAAAMHAAAGLRSAQLVAMPHGARQRLRAGAHPCVRACGCSRRTTSSSADRWPTARSSL